MAWWRKPPDLSLSNEYQELTRGGCINCGALLEVLKSVNMNTRTIRTCACSAWWVAGRTGTR
jgi:hypothetical protein